MVRLGAANCAKLKRPRNSFALGGNVVSVRIGRPLRGHGVTFMPSLVHNQIYDLLPAEYTNLLQFPDRWEDLVSEHLSDMVKKAIENYPPHK